jgi:hypothetical protein
MTHTMAFAACARINNKITNGAATPVNVRSLIRRFLAFVILEALPSRGIGVQGLKPHEFVAFFGTTKVVPFHENI